MTQKGTIHNIIEWDPIIAKIPAKGLVDKVNRMSLLMAEGIQERYLSFLGIT